MDELVREFLVETRESLDQLDRDLLLLEQYPGAPDLLAGIFRTVHSIKGTSGLLGLERLEALTHAGEGLLARSRGARSMAPGTVDVLLRMVDVARDLLASVGESGGEGPVQVDGTIRQLDTLLAGGPAPSSGRSANRTSSPPPCRDRPGRSVQVAADVLDELTHLCEELLLARDQVLALTGARPTDHELSCAAHRLDAAVSAVHEGARRTRMQPVSHVWSKFPRLVRDLGLRNGKQVRVAMVGRDTELDRAVLEAVRDPLTHLVRNAVDHGVETPQERTAAGKSSAGTVTLRARRDRQEVVLEVCDDGAGVDVAGVVAAARRSGALDGEQVALMTRPELLRLVLLPGLSTAGAVTRLSGRGVGMDVVRTNVEELGGSVHIESSVGVGTTCRLLIPI